MKMFTVPLYPLNVLIILYTLLCLWLITPSLIYGSQVKFNPNDAKSLRDSLLVIAENNWEMPQKDIIEHMNKIAYVESLGKINAVQHGGGPGRGMFQYETGYKQGGHTAINRLINQFDFYPTFLDGLVANNYDVSGLSQDAQEALFLADKLQDPSASFKGIENDSQLKKEWFEEHYAGPDSLRTEKYGLFDRQLKDYYGKKNKKTK